MIPGDSIPEHWEVKLVSEVATVNPRVSLPKQDDYPYVPMDVINPDTHIIDRFDRRDSVYSGLAKFSEGDIVVARITPCFENGNVAVVDRLPDGEACAVGSSELVVIRPTDILPQYLFHFLKSPAVLEWGKKRLSGATGRERVKISQFRDELMIPVPPLEEQKHIVAVLDEAFASLDRVESLSSDVDALSTEFIDALSHHTFNPEETPDDWSTRTIGEICINSFNGGTPKRSDSRYWGGGIPWLSSGEIRGHQITSAEESITQTALDESSAKLFPANSVLVAMYGGGTRGRSAILREEMSGNQAICCLVPDPSVCTVEYLWQYLRHIKSELSDKGRGGAQKNLNKSIITSTQIPIPPIKTQKAIVHHLNQAYNSTNSVLNDKNNISKIKDDMEVSVLTQAFTGGFS